MRWMLINAILPEFAFAKAWSDLAAARLMTTELASFAEQDHVDWTLAHSFFAGMGGFAIQFSDDSQKETEESKEKNCGGEAAAAVSVGSMSIRDSFHSHGNLSDEENQLQQTASINSSLAGSDSLEISGGEVVQSTLHGNSGLNGGENSLVEKEVGRVRKETKSNNDNKSEYQHATIRYTSSGVAVNVTNMPDHVQYLVFGDLLGSGGLDVYEAFNEIVQRWIGPVDWKVDCENRNTVVSVLESVTLASLEHRRISWFRNVLLLQGNFWVPNASQLLYARKQGIIDKLPSLPAEHLDDMSKASTMAKLITLVQTVWLILQLIVRKAENLTTTPLEISVLAFAAISFVTYITLWKKPQDIQRCLYIMAARRPSPVEVDDMGHLGQMGYGPARRTAWIPNNCFEIKGQAGNMFRAGLITAAIFFGGLHCLAWNSHFPTPTERLLWRIASVYITASLSFSLSIGLFLRGLIKVLKHFGKLRGPEVIFSAQEIIFSSFLALSILGYTICRLYMTVEMFRSLFFLTPDAFIDTNWPSYWPHFM